MHVVIRLEDRETGIVFDSLQLDSDFISEDDIVQELSNRGYDNIVITSIEKNIYHAVVKSVINSAVEQQHNSRSSRLQPISLEDESDVKISLTETPDTEQESDHERIDDSQQQETYGRSTDDLFTDELLSASQDLFSSAFLSPPYSNAATALASPSPSLKSDGSMEFSFSPQFPLFPMIELNQRLEPIRAIYFQIQKDILLVKRDNIDSPKSSLGVLSLSSYLSVYDKIENISVRDLKTYVGSREIFEISSSTRGTRIFSANESDKIKFLKCVKISQRRLQRQSVEKQLTEHNPLAEILDTIAWQEEQISSLFDALQDKWAMKASMETKIENLAKRLTEYRYIVESANQRQNTMINSVDAMKKGKVQIMEKCMKAMDKVEEISHYVKNKEELIQSLEQQLHYIQKRERCTSLWKLTTKCIIISFIIFRLARWFFRVIHAILQVRI